MVVSKHENIREVLMEVASLGLLGYEKNIIEDYIARFHFSLPKQSVKWLPANADNLKVVIIRASFIGSSEVTTYLHKLSSDTVVLSVGKKKDDNVYAVNNNIDMINIFETNANIIQAWVNKIPVNKIVPSKGMNPRIHESSDQFNSLASVKAVKDLFALFSGLTAILYLRTKQAQFVWIDCLKGKVYLDTNNIVIPAIEHYEWKILSPNFDPEQQINVDKLYIINLNEWIWEVIWRSCLDFSSCISANSFENCAYQLVHWPHFCQYRKIGRSESLRLSARIKRNPQSYNELLLDSGYNKSTVSKFIYSMLTINFIQAVFIGDNDMRFDEMKMNASENKQFDQSKKNFIKRSFLSNLRILIGLSP